MQAGGRALVMETVVSAQHAANCVTSAVNCHPEHIVCLPRGAGYETILVFVFNELRLFCGDVGTAGTAVAHMRLSPAAIRQRDTGPGNRDNYYARLNHEGQSTN